MSEAPEVTRSERPEERLPGWLSTYLTGLAMGSADAVPGVSGGTIALIAGIYDRLVGAIASFEPSLLVDAVEQRSVRPLVELLVGMDVRFLAGLGVGVATGVVGVSQVLGIAYRDYAGLTYAFFFGLIAASAVALRDEADLRERRSQVAAAVGVTGAFLLAGVGAQATIRSPLVVFLAGAFVICAMILPGVSGSFFLVLFDLHDFMVGQLNAFVEALLALATGGSLQAVRAPAVYVVAFCTGAGLGLLTFARVVQAALERDRKTTLTFLVALMVGALRLPAQRVLATVSLTPPDVAAVVAAAVLGALAVAGLDAYGGVGYD